MVKRIILILLCIVNLSLITMLSTQNAKKSNELSKNVTQKIISPIYSEEKIEENILKSNETIRTTAHFVLFLTLGIILCFTIKSFHIKHSFLYSFIMCIIYALFDEIYQELLHQGRAFEFVDLLKDWSGSTVGVLAVYFIYKLRRKQ